MEIEGKLKTQPTYVLITPARNEAAFIGQTIISVIQQTVLPLKWIIVSDGSADGTEEIVKSYVAKYGWIELLRFSGCKDRNFGTKVHAFNAGYAQVRTLKFDIVGNLEWTNLRTICSQSCLERRDENGDIQVRFYGITSFLNPGWMHCESILSCGDAPLMRILST